VVLAHGEMAAAMGGAFGGGGFGGAGSPGGDAGAPPPPVQALGTVAGARALDENSLIASLRGIVDAFEPLLVAARAEQNERLVERMMREQQEEEYARSLAEDQAREAREAEAGAAAAAVARAAAAEAAAAQAAAAQAEAAAEAKRAARAAKATSLAPEPTAGADDATRLVIRLSDGRRLDRRFGKRERLQAVVDYIESELPDIYDGADFELVSNYPRKVFSAETRSATLEDLGLCPQATLFTKEMDEA
jgi:chemotaxis protein histidine kinase CheA